MRGCPMSAPGKPRVMHGHPFVMQGHPRRARRRPRTLFIAPAHTPYLTGTFRLSGNDDRPMLVNDMILPHRPMSNTERQRQFRQRNPGYYGRLHRKYRAEAEAFAKRKAAMAQWMLTQRM